MVRGKPEFRSVLGLLLAPALLAAGCRRGPASRAVDDAPEVVAADGVLCDLSRTLAAEDLQLSCLLEPGADPHTFSLRPTQARTLQEADLVLINGLDLTPALADLPGDARVVAVAEEASVEAVPLEGDGGHGSGEGGAHHHHGDVDPHVWHDPRNTARMAEEVARRLAAVAPQAEPRLQERTRRAVEVLQELDAWAVRQIATVPPGRRALASTHRAFATYARRYGLREVPLLDAFGGEGVLRPDTLAAFGRRLEQAGAEVLFPEQDPPSRALRTLAERSGIPLAERPLTADGLAPGSTTVGTFVDNTCTIVGGLGGSCDRAEGEDLERRWRGIPAVSSRR